MHHPLGVVGAGHRHPCEGGHRIIQRKRMHHVPNEVHRHVVLAPLVQALHRQRAPWVQGHLVGVVIGLEEKPITFARQAPHRRRVCFTFSTVAVHANDGAFVVPRASHNEVLRCHELRAVEQAQRRVKVWDRLQRLASDPAKLPSSILGRLQVEMVVVLQQACVLLKGPAIVAHGCVNTNPKRPIDVGKELLATLPKDALVGDVGPIFRRSIRHCEQELVVHVPAMNHLAIGVRGKEARAHRGGLQLVQHVEEYKQVHVVRHVHGLRNATELCEKLGAVSCADLEPLRLLRGGEFALQGPAKLLDHRADLLGIVFRDFLVSLLGRKVQIDMEGGHCCQHHRDCQCPPDQRHVKESVRYQFNS
mmetsp:Transcript_99546/g.237371  ORF Transcript_99546/g.237371 Transcript_99546/m.237371 type:complete len:362 (+) Transcript_99546:193-1278(+)